VANHEAWHESRRAAGGIVGTPAQVVDFVGQYRDAGLDELIVPDFTLGGTLERRQEACDLLIEEVAPSFR
jgi:alkanesulfonate monooxygenase SsuD/methylene tetrahydromethanopterin reductase-like flavin-dependent oxidoreductase (luciferase family)